MYKAALCNVALSLVVGYGVSAQKVAGKLVKAAQTEMHQHTVHVLVCSRPGPKILSPNCASCSHVVRTLHLVAYSRLPERRGIWKTLTLILSMKDTMSG
jgi:hypothetical protein